MIVIALKELIQKRVLEAYGIDLTRSQYSLRSMSEEIALSAFGLLRSRQGRASIESVGCSVRTAT